MTQHYVLTGPATCGNIFGYSGKVSIPAGRAVLAHDDEYTDGGCGPILSENRLYGSQTEAQAALDAILAREGGAA